MRKNFLKLSFGLLFALLAICLICFTGCDNSSKKHASIPYRYYDDAPDETILDESAEPGIPAEFTVSGITDNFDIHLENQRLYLSDDVLSIEKYASDKADKSRCEKLSISWTLDVDEPSEFVKYEIKVSEYKDLSNPYTYSSTSGKCDILNLKIGTLYYLRIYAKYIDQTYKSQIITFTTADTAPRTLFIAGIENCRDLGGWTTSDGGKIRQGLVFRTSRLNENSSKGSRFTGNGKKFIKYFGIKTEIDLRQPEMSFVTESPIGDDVRFINIPMEESGNILKEQPEQIKEVLTLFADESNYPILFHCSGGMDRAGCIAFVLEGLLGLGEDDLRRDYLFSNFSTSGIARSSSTVDAYIAEIKTAEGDTLSEQFFNYLLGIGLTEDQLLGIIYIMRTKPAQ